MPESGVVLRATYKDLPAETTPVTTVLSAPESVPESTADETPDTTPETDAPQAPNENSPLRFAVYGTIGVGFVMVIVLMAVVLINKKKE